LAPGERLGEAINRSWSRLLGLWSSFDAARETLSERDAGTTLTRERWLLPLFGELGFGRLAPARAVEIDTHTNPVSHERHRSPMHLVSLRLDLDRRVAGVAGAARQSPHARVQELLKRSDQRLWGFVSNGLRLRVLRDNASLTRQAYVEWDLEAMMSGDRRGSSTPGRAGCRPRRSLGCRRCGAGQPRSATSPPTTSTTAAAPGSAERAPPAWPARAPHASKRIGDAGDDQRPSRTNTPAPRPPDALG
jgi:hypothetical protein